MAENPPLNRIYVLGYSANDRDYPIVSLNADPRVAGYQVPKDLSACPDKRYPNHVFTGAQPISGDERVRHVWEILPSPYVPFTRYDDDLGPVQGRRRSVKNDGQVASREANKQVTYEAREGSAIVYTELEETWSIKTDEDGNSLFPIRDRDFYDASRGPVQERRQLFVPTGEEEGSLENVNGVITQTSYEPYNDFLSVKIVQTYKVDGPQLIGRATDNEGQLVTITTQRKAADGYVPTSPTATRTVEANREDAESLVERIVDTPQVFGAEIYRKTKEDLTPQKFKAAQEDSTVEQNIEGTASPTIALATGEFAKSEQQISKFVKRVSTTLRSTTVNPDPLIESVLTNEGQLGTRTLTLSSGPQTITPSAVMVDANVEALGDGRTVKTEVVVPSVFAGKVVQKSRIDLTPEKFKAKQEDETTEESVAGTLTPASLITLGAGEFRKSEQQVTEFVKRVSTTTRDVSTTQTLSESLVTPQGQVATRTLNLVTVNLDNPPVLTPDAKTVDASIEALGDGRVVISETRVGNVFPNKTISAEFPDITPQKFRTFLKIGSEEFSQAGTISEEIIFDNISGQVQLSKSEQQVTEFVKRINRTYRDVATGATPPLQGEVFTREMGGGIAVVTETFPSPSIDFSTPDFGTISDEVENLGGQKIRKQVKLRPQLQFFPEEQDEDGNIPSEETMPVLNGQEYDQELDIVIPYKQVVAKADSSRYATGNRRRVVPRDLVHSEVTRYDVEDVQESLDEYFWEIPDMINVTLPDKLLSVGVAQNGSKAEAMAPTIDGDTYSYSQEKRNSVGGTLFYRIEQGFSGVVPTIRCIFFLPKGNASPSDVLSRVRTQKSNPSIQFWPNVRPQSHQIAIIETSSSEQTSNSVSFDSAATSTSTSSSVNTSISTIPVAIHGEIDPISVTGNLNGAGTLSINPSSLPSSKYLNPNNVDEAISKFPTGLFLYQINATPYRFSYVRIDALLVEITSNYV